MPRLLGINSDESTPFGIVPLVNKLAIKPTWLRVCAILVQINIREDWPFINERVLMAPCIDKLTCDYSRLCIIDPFDNVNTDGKHIVSIKG